MNVFVCCLKRFNFQIAVFLPFFFLPLFVLTLFFDGFSRTAFSMDSTQNAQKTLAQKTATQNVLAQETSAQNVQKTLAQETATQEISAQDISVRKIPRPSRTFSPVNFSHVRLTDEFWAPTIEINRTVSIPHNIKWCEQTDRLNNFRVAGGLKDGKFQGIYFNDSDVYKALEGIAASLFVHPDAELQKIAEDWISAFEAAQQKDGYLNSYYTLVEPENRWSDLAYKHELYCAGHLTEAAVAYSQATGDDRLLRLTCRFIDLILERYNWENIVSVPGHEELELALVKLFMQTGETKYLDGARFFIDARGVNEHNGKKNIREKGLFGEYCQDHRPVREQTEIVGHAVRAMYLYSGATDVAAYDNDQELKNAMIRLWNNVTRQKMYLTGGIGSDARNEGFSEGFYLPNQSAYAETCAAIGLVFWAHRMNLMTGEGTYADIMERALYNGVLSGYAINGDRYFYVNPLESNGGHHRQPFFDCACCPSNLVRLIPSIPGYVYSTAKSKERQEQELDGDDTVVVNLFIQGKALIPLAEGSVEIEQTTRYPFDDLVVIRAFAVPKDGKTPTTPFRVRVRIPDWVQEGAASSSDLGDRAENGYIDIDCAGSTYFHFGVEPRRIIANPQVKADQGRVALMAGPLVYCFEQCDNTVPVDQIILSKNPKMTIEHRENYIADNSEKAPNVPSELTENSSRRDVNVIVCEDIQGRKLTAVPYFAWDNRAPGKMAVWVRQEGLPQNPLAFFETANENSDSKNSSPKNSVAGNSSIGVKNDESGYSDKKSDNINNESGYSDKNDVWSKENWTDEKGEPILYRKLTEKYLSDELTDWSGVKFFSASFEYPSSDFTGADEQVAPKNSADHSIPRSAFWPHKGTSEWIQYDFVKPQTVSSTSVYWFDDTGIGGCRVPESWTLSILPEGSDEWISPETSSEFGVSPDREHQIEFKPVCVKSIRINVQLQKDFSAGILKWNVR